MIPSLIQLLQKKIGNKNTMKKLVNYLNRLKNALNFKKKILNKGN